ncbi:hypothetical protein DVA76_19450, partial [Acinetobacter baumannii]
IKFGEAVFLLILYEDVTQCLGLEFLEYILALGYASGTHDLEVQAIDSLNPTGCFVHQKSPRLKE